MPRADLRPQQLNDLLDACREMIDAFENRPSGVEGLTIDELQAIAVLWIRLDDLREMEAAA